MAQTTVNHQNQQFIGQQTIDRQHLEQLEASIDHVHPAEWMKLYEDKANAAKKDLITMHEEVTEIMDSLNGCKREIKLAVSAMMEQKAKTHPVKETIAGLMDEIQNVRTRMKRHVENRAVIRRKRGQKIDEMKEYWKRYDHWNLVDNGWSWNDQSKFGRFYYVRQEVLECVVNASDDETAESISKKVWKLRDKFNVKLVRGLTNPIFV